MLVAPPGASLARAFPSDSALRGDAARFDRAGAAGRLRGATARAARPPEPIAGGGHGRDAAAAKARRGASRPPRPAPPPAAVASPPPTPGARETPPDERRPRQPGAAGAGAAASWSLLHFYVRPRLWERAGEPRLPARRAGALRDAERAGGGRAGRLRGRARRPTRSRPRAFGAGALAHTVVGYLAAWGRAVFFADNLLVNAAFVAVALWLRDLILLVASGTAAGQVAGWSSRCTVRSRRSPRRCSRCVVLAGVPGVVRHPAGRMNGFDSYRVRERADVARWVLVGAFLVLAGRVLPDPDHPAREVPAPGRDQPAPADLAHAAPRARSSTARARSSPRTSPATRSSCSRRPPTRSGRCSPGSAASCRSTPRTIDGDRPALRARPATSRRWCSATPPSRPSPGWRSTAPCCPGLRDPVGAQAAVPGRQGGGPPGGLRLRGDRADLDSQPLSRAPDLGSIVGKAGLEREYDDTLRGAEGVRYIEVNARGPPGAGGRRAARRCRRRPGTPDQHHDRPRPPALHRQHLAGGRARRHDRDDARRARSGRSTRRRRYDPNVVRRRHLHRATGARSTTDEARPLLNRAIQTRYPPASPFKLAIARDGAEARADRPRHPHAARPAAAGCGWATGCSAAGRRKATARST